MSRISKRFEQLRQQGRKALIPFITAGDPDAGVSVPLMHAMVEAGADLIELGVPFSDPMADGPVIQAASERALKAGMDMDGVLELVKTFRQTNTDTPVILMGYLNPIEVSGYETFSRRAAEAGVDGVLTVDLPPEEADSLVPALRDAGLDPIFLIAPTSDAARMRAICDTARGFVYYVSLKGVTGAANLDIDAVDAKLQSIRKLTDLPIGVGFGIRDAASAQAVARHADAVVVGSAVVKHVAEHQGNTAAICKHVGDLLGSIRHALDQIPRQASA